MAWSWGAGTQGQLGLGETKDEMFPRPVHGLRILDMACGGAHVAAILADDNVGTWGRGPIGHGDDNENPVVASQVVHFPCKIYHVATGWNHTAFVSEYGELYTCGDGSFGQLGHGDFKTRSTARKIMNLSDIHKAACGMRHTLVLTGEGKVKAFGHGKRGQLGIVSSKRVWSPQDITSLDSCRIASVTANGDHSAALDDSGKLYLWGKSYDNRPDIVHPCVADEHKFEMVSLGWNHGLGLTDIADDGEIFSWGSNRYGQLGTSQHFIGCTAENSSIQMYKVEALENSKVVCISAGSEHSAALLANGELFTWGWGEHGQLGLGHLNDEVHPCRVELGCKIGKVYCGSGFTFAIE